MNTPPPPLPSTGEYGGYLAKYAPAEKKTYTSVVDQVMDGTRFVTIPFVISIVILSFQRNMGGVHEVRTGAYPIGKMVPAALITILVGFWGLPFGVIYSILTCFYLWKGGRDATLEVLTHAVGKEEARRILSIAPKPQPPASIWIVRAIVAAPFLLVGLLIFSIIKSQ